jgi:hypothetical protein
LINRISRVFIGKNKTEVYSPPPGKFNLAKTNQVGMLTWLVLARLEILCGNNTGTALVEYKQALLVAWYAEDES